MQMQTAIQQDYGSEINLGNLSPLFKYNIFRFVLSQIICICKEFPDRPDSHVRNDFLFEKPVGPSNVSLFIEVLKSDELELRFYQV
jgi:hypothetical protein